MARRRKVEEKAYDFIKNQITTSQWLEGRQIKELEIADVLEVSRTPIRNAFLRLEEEGFVSILPNKGVFVAQTTIDLKGLKDRLYYLETLFQHVLYSMERAETDLSRGSFSTLTEQMRKTIQLKSEEFEQLENLFWKAVLEHHDNMYMNQSILHTLHSIYGAEGHARNILNQSRQVKLSHYQNISDLLGENNYVYARREVRILLNQLLINLIQGID